MAAAVVAMGQEMASSVRRSLYVDVHQRALSVTHCGLAKKGMLLAMDKDVVVSTMHQYLQKVF